MHSLLINVGRFLVGTVNNVLSHRLVQWLDRRRAVRHRGRHRKPSRLTPRANVTEPPRDGTGRPLPDSGSPELRETIPASGAQILMYCCASDLTRPMLQGMTSKTEQKRITVSFPVDLASRIERNAGGNVTAYLNRAAEAQVRRDEIAQAVATLSGYDVLMPEGIGDAA